MSCISSYSAELTSASPYIKESRASGPLRHEDAFPTYILRSHYVIASGSDGQNTFPASHPENPKQRISLCPSPDTQPISTQRPPLPQPIATRLSALSLKECKRDSPTQLPLPYLRPSQARHHPNPQPKALWVRLAPRQLPTTPDSCK